MTLDEIFEETVEVKRSKFIARLLPSDLFDDCLERAREQHPKASHIVTASRRLNSCDQIVESSSDDGEPRGCAGLPVLNVLRGADLIDAALLVIRYFGGTKLGTGGMVRAYTHSARTVLLSAALKEYRRCSTLYFATDYSSVQRVSYLLTRQRIPDAKRAFLGDSVTWEIEADEAALERFRQEAGRMIRVGQE